MSYGTAAALQAAVYQTLTADAALVAIVGSAIYDAVPVGSLPSIYVSIGTETVKDRSDQTGAGSEHELTISVITELAGFAVAKDAAGAVSDALAGATMVLSRGTLIAMNFYRAKASRVGTNEQRQIDLTFKALVEDD